MATVRSQPHRRLAAGRRLVAGLARDGAILSPAESRHRRDRQPLIFWLLFGAGLSGSFRLATARRGPSFLRILLSRQPVAHRAVHGHLRHDLDHRRPPRGVFAGGARRADSPLVDGAGQSARRDADCGLPRIDLSPVRANVTNRVPVAGASRPPGSLDAGRTGAHQPGLCICLAARQHARLSCDHEPRADADVAFVGRLFSSPRSCGRNQFFPAGAAPGDAGESAHLCGFGSAANPLAGTRLHWKLCARVGLVLGSYARLCRSLFRCCRCRLPATGAGDLQ